MVSSSIVPTMSATTSAMSRLSPSEAAASASPNHSAFIGAALTQPHKITRKRSRELTTPDKVNDAVPAHKNDAVPAVAASSASNRKVGLSKVTPIAASARDLQRGKAKQASGANSDASDEEYEHHEEEEDEEVDHEVAAIPFQKSRSASSPVSSLSAIHCGVVNAAGERMYRRKCPFFASLVSLGGREFTVPQPMVNVYTAETDGHRRTLYCCGDLAKRFEATNDAKRMNKVGMWMSRRKNVDGVFQATAIVHKEQGPDSRAGLKTSGYFFTLEIAKQYQQHVIAGRKRLEEAYQSGQLAAAALQSEVEETGSRLSTDQSDAAEAMVDIPARVAQRTAASATSASSSDESSTNEEAPVETVVRPVRAANGGAADLMSAAVVLAEAASASPNKKQKTVEYAKAIPTIVVKEVKSEFAHTPTKESAFVTFAVTKKPLKKEGVVLGQQVPFATPAIATTTTATFMPQYGMHPTSALGSESAFTSSFHHPPMKPMYPQQPGFLNQQQPYQLPLPSVPPFMPSYTQYSSSMYPSTAQQQPMAPASYAMPSYSHSMQTQYYAPSMPAQPMPPQSHQGPPPPNPHQFVTHMHTVMTSNQTLLPNNQAMLSQNGPSAFTPTNPHPYYASLPR